MAKRQWKTGKVGNAERQREIKREIERERERERDRD